MEDRIARASVHIDSPRQAVWAALLLPDSLTKVMPVEEVVSGWRQGEPFAWVVKLGARQARVEGVVRRLDEGRLLAYEYGDPHSREVLHRENIHQVTITLSDEGAGARVVVTQDSNISDAALAHAEGGWRMMLNSLRVLVEQRGSGSA